MAQDHGVYHPQLPAPASRTRHVLLLIALLLVATVPVITVAEPSPSASASTATVIATDVLHLRDCPSFSCRLGGSAPLGSQLEVTGEAVDGFVPVRFDRAEGWGWHLFLSHQSDRSLIRQGVAGCDRVAIIFNAGIGHQPSEAILETLAKTQAPVTVFAMGWWADVYPDYLQQLDTDTRALIGSHGNTQTFLTDASDAQVVDEVRTSAARIEAVLGYPIARYFTPYATDTDGRVEGLVAGQGFLPVGWTVAGADYNDDDTADDVRNRVLDSVEDGAIIELHLDGPATDTSTAIALPQIIEELGSKGYSLVTIPEIVLPCPAAP